MLSSIGIKNLGCFDDYSYSVKFKKLNVIVGPNNSGKTMILKALNLVRDYCDRGGVLAWNNLLCSLESNRVAVYNHDMNRMIEITVQYKVDSDLYDANLSIQNDARIIDQFSKNNQNQGTLAHTVHKKLTSQIWYFRPERDSIPYLTEIGAYTGGLQPISPSGNNVMQYILERFNARDERYSIAEEWIRKIDAKNSLLKTPVTVNSASVTMDRNDGKTSTEVNLSQQGSGINNAITIIAGIIFSPPNSTIIIEEPENYLNSRSIEYLVDLFNYAVNHLSKQIIITTHSWEIMMAYCSDIGEGKDRGNTHEKANPDDFQLIVFNEKLGSEKITYYDIRGRKFSDVRSYFKDLWG